MHESGDRIVAAGRLGHGAASGVGSTRVQEANWPAAQATGSVDPQSPAVADLSQHTRHVPGVVRQVVTDGGAELPIKGSHQIVVQDISTDAHVVHEHGHVGTLSGQRRA